MQFVEVHKRQDQIAAQLNVCNNSKKQPTRTLESGGSTGGGGITLRHNKRCVALCGPWLSVRVPPCHLSPAMPSSYVNPLLCQLPHC